jgi:threonine/homoserine/homoserine lactone efflux protein
MLPYLVQGIAYGFAAAVQPGPFLTYLISLTLRSGWRRALPVVCAPLISDGPIITLVLFVLSHIPAWWVQFLRIAGGGFLLYLALNALRAWRDYDPQAMQSPRAGTNLLRAALVNLLNPNPYIYWSLVMGPLLLTAWREAPANGVTLLLVFYLTMISVTAGIMLLFAFARRIGPQVSRALLGLSALALAGFGLYQIWVGFSVHGV